MQARGHETFFADVGVAGADGAHHLAGQVRAAAAERGVALPAVVERSQQKTIEIIGKMRFEIRTGDCCFGHGLQQNAGFQGRVRNWSVGCRTRKQSIFHFGEKIMANRTAHGMLREFSIRVHFQRAVEVVC